MDQPATAATRRRQILEALRGRSDGVSRQELQSLASLQDLDEQAVRRLLAHLVEQGAARVTGQTKARRYFLVQGAQAPAPPEEPGPPLSRAAEASARFLALPLPQRPPVGHRPAFLEAYRPNETFYLAGEVRERLAALGRPFAPASQSRPQRLRLLTDLVWDSARLEGSSYSRLETERLIEHDQPAAGKPLRDTQLVLNLKAAIEFLMESDRAAGIDPTTIQNLSAMLTENLLAEPGDEGRLRSGEAAIPGTAYRPPAAPQAAAGFRQLLRTAAGIKDPFEQSFFLLVHLPYLHPFSGGNPATARLAANLPFLRRNTVPVCFLGVPPALFSAGLLAVFEQNQVALLRDLFVHACERSWAWHGLAAAAPALPDPFRLQHRNEIKAAVRAVVLAGEGPAEAQARVRTWARTRLPREAREGFLAAVEAELAGLHDGNFARYQLRPSEFAAWKPRMRLR